MLRTLLLTAAAGVAQAVTTKGVATSNYIEAADHASIFTVHSFCEHTTDLGEIRMNYATAGGSDKPALLLIPGQTESWWGYETVMWLLKDDYQVYAVDMRGQGRSTWTPGRYSLDNFGSDLVRFIDLVVQRPVVVAGLSSGGVMSAWLSAFAKPGQIVGAIYEDPPLFASEAKPAVGQSVLQTVAGPYFDLWYKWLGGQWTIGDTTGMNSSTSKEIPSWIQQYLTPGQGPAGLDIDLTEYDPEWGHAFVSGSIGTSCDHQTLLTQVKKSTPVFMTHHFAANDPTTGNLLGAVSDTQVGYVQDLIAANGNGSFTLQDFPTASHNLHGTQPAVYVEAITSWMSTNLTIGAVALNPSTDDVSSASASVAAASTAPPSCGTATASFGFASTTTPSVIATTSTSAAARRRQLF
ncbi:hypothetical protein SCUCBS95973_003975 [Sporothrix curviconia]|uniref:AB hydrolase-1 domain-containing protein n=1 Tax=Sporothrix curviconia TaxID=1260050 RepID=A0ABP0BJU0_9PEZI